jgi:FtsH-binding integral membrane protein
MDFVNRFTGRQFTPNTLLKFTDLDPRVQQHLTKVYATLTAAVVLSAVGIATNITFHVGGFLSIILAFGSLTWLAFTPASPQNLNKRYALLGAFAFGQGLSVGPLVEAALAISPAIVMTAALATSAIFASFTLSALVTKRRSYLFLGGWLGSAVSAMLMMRLGSWMFGYGRFMFDVEVYLGLLVFAGYVLFDTQLVVERASAGDMDQVQHALDLFVDFMAIAVRVLIILMKNQEKKEEQRRRKRND